MVWEVNGKPYYFDKDFKELGAKQRICVVKMVKNLLMIQKADKAMIANYSYRENEMKTQESEVTDHF
jgi:hypothetical protein